MSDTNSSSVRYDFLDWLRVIAIFVLLFYHTGMLFVGWDFHIRNADTIEALQLPMSMLHRLRMPLLFVIAGAGLWFASKRRSAAGVMKERTLRLLIPVVFGMFVIVPPQIFIERLFQDQWHGGYLQFYAEQVLQFQPYPQGNFSWHHLWFIVYLFFYVPLLLPLIHAFKRGAAKIVPGMWLFLLALPLGLNEALLKPLFPTTHALIDDWYTFTHYLLLTAYGVLLAYMPGAWDWLERHRRTTLGVATATTIVALALLETGTLARDTVAERFLANAFTWFWLLAFLAYGRRYLSKSNAVLRWARDASYPIYILHQTVMLIVAYWIIAQPWAPWTKFGIVVAATALGSAAIYELIVRRFAVTRFFFGMKPKQSCERMLSGCQPSTENRQPAA